MKNLFTLILLVTLTGILSQTYGQWIKHTIDQSLSNATIVDVADIDEDGDLDMVANGSDKVQWYENNSPDTTWTEYTIDNLFRGVVGIAIVDIDGDGTLDVVASGYTDSDIRWYKNEGGTPINWFPYIIDDDFYGAEFLVVADIDADGDSDVVLTSSFGGKVAWYENNLPNTNWTPHTIDDNLQGALVCEVGDIDGDGDLDVAATGNTANDVRWYENNLPDTNWNQIIIDGNLSGAFGLCIADIDGDDTLDVLATGQAANKLVWYKNENSGQTWTEYPIDANLSGARIVNVADIDGDGTPDVVATAFYADDVVGYVNLHPNWPKYIIDTGLDGANWVCTAYINDDNMLDVVATGRVSGKLNWYEQPPLWVRTVEIFPKYLIPEGDTLFIKAHIVNQENHSVSVYAKIFGGGLSGSDSLLLYDDGLHFDENPNDNIWGNAKFLSGLEEDIYKVDIYKQDLSTGTIYKPHLLNYFTTIGPVVFDNYVITSNDTVPNPGDQIRFKLELHNNGLTTTAGNIKAVILTTDSCISEIIANRTNYGDIPAGESVIPASDFQYYFVEIDPNCSGNSDVWFNVDIYSDGNFFWSDSFAFHIYNVTAIEDERNSLPDKYTLHQNYPNPFNPTTTIHYQIPELSFVTIKIYDVLGSEIATLVNEENPVGSYEIKFDVKGLPSGIYFYRLQAGSFVETKKMVLLR